MLGWLYWYMGHIVLQIRTGTSKCCHSRAELPGYGQEFFQLDFHICSLIFSWIMTEWLLGCPLSGSSTCSYIPKDSKVWILLLGGAALRDPILNDITARKLVGAKRGLKTLALALDFDLMQQYEDTQYILAGWWTFMIMPFLMSCSKNLIIFLSTTLSHC